MSESPETSGRVLSARQLAAWSGVLFGATMLVWLICTLIGVYELSWNVWQTRAYRLLAAATVGAGLAAAGMALQGMLRNPLAEPYILGVSSGAGVGVLAGLALGARLHWPDWLSTTVLGLAGAMATCAVVYGIAQRRGRLDPYILLLSGVIVNVFNGAVIFAVLLVARYDQLTRFIGWGMGKVPDDVWFQPKLMVFCAVWVVGGWAVLLIRGAAFNALGLGDDVAASSGVAVHWLRVETFIVVSLMTAAAVALAGPIGFIGLIVPHVCRLVVGPDHRKLVIISGFAGAVFLMVADTFCRTAGQWFRLGEIPVGIVTAFCGGPFFIYLLRRRSREAAP